MTLEKVEEVEDLIAKAIEGGVQFGMRCGCEDCDNDVAELVLKIEKVLTE